MNKATLTAFHTDLDAAIRAVAQKHGMTFKQVGAMGYDPVLGTVKYNTMFGEISTMGGEIDPIALKNTRHYGHLFGLDIVDIGKLEFTYSGRQFIFMGLRTRGKASIKEISTSKVFNLNAEVVSKAASRCFTTASLQQAFLPKSA